MKEAIKNSLKAAATFFLVGVVLTVLAPAIAHIAGVELPPPGPANTALNPMWNGLYFAGFGLFAGLIQPTLEFILGDNANSKEKALPQEQEKTQQIFITVEREPQKCKEKQWQKAVMADRTTCEHKTIGA